MQEVDQHTLAYVIGLALGDGNLSNPNGRATRLRITCDLKYPAVIIRITQAVQKILPSNKVHIVKRTQQGCLDISCYSNQWEDWLGWRAGKGSKFAQQAHAPNWIKENPDFIRACLKGLFETDGSVYNDRGYKMAIFVTIIPKLAEDVSEMIKKIGFISHAYEIPQKPPQQTRYNIRISKNTEKFIQALKLDKR